MAYDIAGRHWPAVRLLASVPSGIRRELQILTNPLVERVCEDGSDASGTVTAAVSGDHNIGRVARDAPAISNMADNAMK